MDEGGGTVFARTAHLQSEAAAGYISRPALWCRGIPEDLAKCLPQPSEEPDISLMGHHHMWEGDAQIFLDGAGGPRSRGRRLRRCGWAAAKLS